MKTMTRFFSLAALLLTAAGFTACSSDSNTVIDQPEVTPAPKTYSVSIDAAKGDDGSISRALSLDGDNNLSSAWAEGEEVTVYNTTQGAALEGTLTAQTAGANTTLAGTLTGNIAADDELLLKFCSDSYNSQDGTLAYISANCDYATATVTVDNVTESAFYVADAANFVNQQAIIKFTLKDKGNSDELINPTAFTITDGTSTVTLSNIPDGTYTTNGDGVLFVAFPAAGEAKTITLTATVGSKTYTYERADVTFTNSEFWTIPVKMTESDRMLSSATTVEYGMVVCAAGHLHDAKTAVPEGCTAVGILGKVTETGHGLILALQDAPTQTWNTINGWTSVTTYANTTLKVLPNDAARGSLKSYTTLGETAVSNWAAAQKSDYEAIFTNLGSTKNASNGITFDDNVNAYITTGVGGTAFSGIHWVATGDGSYGWIFGSANWSKNKYLSDRPYSIRPVLAF